MDDICLAARWTGFARFQRELTKFNRRRLEPSLPEPGWRGDVGEQCRVLEAEGAFVEAVRAEIAPLVADIPQDVDGFIAWFERLRESGPGQGDAAFPVARRQGDIAADDMVPRAGSRRRGRLRRSAGVHPGQDARAGKARDGAQLLGRNGTRRQQGHARPDAGAPGRITSMCIPLPIS